MFSELPGSVGSLLDINLEKFLVIVPSNVSVAFSLCVPSDVITIIYLSHIF